MPQHDLTELPFGLKGKVFRSPMPFSAYDPERVVLSLYHAQGVHSVFVLPEGDEIMHKTGRDLLAQYTAEGFMVTHNPIPDFGIPQDADRFLASVRKAADEASQGRNIAVHCHAGIGRTGLFLSTLARMVLGLSADQAIQWVRMYIPGAVEMPEQIEFLRNLSLNGHQSFAADALDWKLIRSELSISNDRLSVRANTYELPDGKTIEPYFLFDFPNWVNVVALTVDQQIVLVRQYRPGAQRTILEIPGGTMDPEDESPLVAAQRELQEETGYISDQFLPLGVIWPNPAGQTNLTYSFLALNARPVNFTNPDETEFLEVVLMPFDEAIQRAQRGEFYQSLHVTALFYALSHLGRIH